MIQTLLDDPAVGRMQMGRIGGELARFGQRMDGDDFPALVEHPQQPGLPAHPDLPAHILRRHGVISPLQLDIAIPMHRAWRFFKHREQTRRQRQQLGAFHFVEHLADLLPGGAVNARVGHAAFPFRKKQVLRRQTFKAAALERVVLGELHARLDLALVLRHGRARRQHHRAVVAAELRHLRVEFGIIPVRPRHRRPQVVDDQRAGNTAEVTKRIFQTPDEALGRLLPDHFTVSLCANDSRRSETDGVASVCRPPCTHAPWPKSTWASHARLPPPSAQTAPAGSGATAARSACTE